MNFAKPIKNLYEHLCVLAKSSPKGIALLECDDEGNTVNKLTYADLKDKIDVVAGVLVRELNTGDKLGLAMPNSAELLIISWAAWSVGIVTVPLDVKRDTLEEHKYKLQTSNVKLLLTKKGIFTSSEEKEFRIKIMDGDNLNTKQRGKIKWKEDITHDALILFTSGTTSKPKGVQLSLKNLIANADAIKEWFKIIKEDRFFVVLPLHHINSTSFCLATLLGGGTIAIPPNYSNSRFWQQTALTEATFTSIVPTICYDQLSRKTEFKKYKTKLNRIQIGSAPVVVSDVKKFINEFKILLYQGYGQTETSLRVTGVPLDSENYHELVESNSIGKAVKGVEVVIMEDGKILGENHEGELAVKGPTVMKGYLNRSYGFANGYFLTGDIGYYKIIDDEKYFFMKGRRKEIIIKGGINLSPVAIEDKLKQLSSDIEQAYVIGIADKRYGEEVAAVLNLKNSKTMLKIKNQLLETTRISEYEKPKWIVSINSKDIPITSTGKVQRSLLKKKNLKFERVDLVVENKDFRFVRLNQNYMKQAFELRNYCWQPLAIDMSEFKKQASNSIVIVAIDSKNKVRGLISLLRTSLSEKELSVTTYSKLTNGNNKGSKIVCYSICSEDYKPQPIGKLKAPSEAEVKEYLESGHDSVYNFHSRAKGGFGKGAKLISIIPKGRPEDKRALGYNMLMKYPKISAEKIKFSKAPVAVQLIEAVMILAKQLGIEDVYVFSRPIDLSKKIKD